MPEKLTQQEVDNKVDPSVSKQYDSEVSREESLKDFYAIADGLKIAMLGTFRPGIGVSVNEFYNITHMALTYNNSPSADRWR
jgi:hypothetical protein